MADKPNKQPKKVFSIASKYSRVLEILNQVDNQSEYICQAVIEKFDGAKENTVADEKLERKIRAILAEMVTDDCVLIAHKGELASVRTVEAAPPPKQEEPTQELELIKNIANMW